jgi:hypothetical protein
MVWLSLWGKEPVGEHWSNDLVGCAVVDSRANDGVAFHCVGVRRAYPARGLIHRFSMWASAAILRTASNRVNLAAR